MESGGGYQGFMRLVSRSQEVSNLESGGRYLGLRSVKW